MIEGGCLCGGVRFQIQEESILLFNQCYCRICRKMTGSAFTSQVQIGRDDFSWLSGESLIASFESSKGNQRTFCKVCGSRLPQPTNSGALFAVPAGLLEGDPGLNPQISMHTANKAPWDSVDDSIPSIPDQGSEEFWRKFMSEL